VVVEFIDSVRDRFGVEPICRVLTEHGCKIAPSSYYAARSRPASARAVRDADLLVQIEAVYHDRAKGRGLAGARKVWHLLRRDGTRVARCTVERLMRRAGLQGARRDRRFITTRPDSAAARPRDRVGRDFTADAPNRLWIVDFTYVPTWSGMAFTAYVSFVFSRRIVGWRTASSMPTELPLDASEMALWARARAGHADDHGRLDGLVHHSDAGSQGEFNRSSQHLDHGGVRWGVGTSSCLWRRLVRGGSGRRIGRCGRRCVHRAGRSRLERCRGTSGGGSRRV
jgi:putative transposase